MYRRRQSVMLIYMLRQENFCMQRPKLKERFSGENIYRAELTNRDKMDSSATTQPLNITTNIRNPGVIRSL